MKKLNDARIYQVLKRSFWGVLAVAFTVLFLHLFRRDMLGEGVIALVLLIPVTWSAYQWGLASGLCAAFFAALAFDFLFIPPYYTFTVGSVEGWLILVIFFAVAIFVVERIQSTLSKAQAREHEAVLLYELGTLLCSLRNQDAIARSVALFIYQRYPVSLVVVFIQPKDQAVKVTAYEPQTAAMRDNPDRTLHLLNSWGLVGEIQIWRSGNTELPPVESHISRKIALQVGLAIERVQITEYERQQAIAHSATSNV